MGTSNPT